MHHFTHDFKNLRLESEEWHFMNASWVSPLCWILHEALTAVEIFGGHMGSKRKTIPNSQTSLDTLILLCSNQTNGQTILLQVIFYLSIVMCTFSMVILQFILRSDRPLVYHLFKWVQSVFSFSQYIVTWITDPLEISQDYVIIQLYMRIGLSSEFQEKDR